MSDISAGTPAPETTAAPATAPETTPAPAATTAPDPWEDATVDKFDRSYVQKLREEAAKYRTTAKPYEEVFGQYADEDREVWFDLAKTLAKDPAAAAERFEQLAQGLRKQFPGEKTPTATELAAEAGAGTDDADKPLTRAELDKYLADRQAKDEQEKAVNSVIEKVGAKYPAGTPEHREALWLAANETGGDIDAALARMEERRQAIIDQYLTGKQSKAETTPNPVTAQGAPSGDGQKVTDFKAARAALEARLAASKG